MIFTKELTKRYGDYTAVDRLNLEIEEGKVFGLLGPNGAGKTTTLKMLITLLRPSSGFAKIFGLDTVKDALKVKKIIGVSPQEINLDKDLTGRENLYLHGLLHRIKNLKERIDWLLNWIDLTEWADHLVKEYSNGMQRRLLIARAIMHKPKVLFLDEPTVGLDPWMRRKIWSLIKKIESQGITVVLTTHYIEEAEILCNTVAILNKGRLIATGSPESLKKEVAEVIVEAREGDRTIKKFFKDRDDANRYACNFKGDVYIRKVNLEDVFIKLTGKRIKEEY
jgi:ABC-2 type transport system ATP-binding protein